MARLEDAVVKTRRYASFFGLPLNLDGLHRWLISDSLVGIKKLEKYEQPLNLTEKRSIETKKHLSEEKIKKARSVANFLSIFPTIKLIAVTGSLAVNNASQNDDIDLMIITSIDTLWLTRPLVVFLLKLLGRRRPPSHPEHNSPEVSNKICDNLWLDESALALSKSKQNLYTAHEVVQAKPIFDRGGTHRRFLRDNNWTSQFLANATKLALDEAKSHSSSSSREPGRPIALVSFLNSLAFRLQYSYMKSKITNETITIHAAFFHPRDLSQSLTSHVG